MSWFQRLFKNQPAEAIGFVRLDFMRTFPHVFWVSSIGRDERSSESCRYKVFTVRHEPEMNIEVLLLRESLDGNKTILAHLRAPLDKFAGTEDMVRRLGQETSVIFDRFDLSSIRTFDEFKPRAIEIGWDYHALGPAE